METLTDTISPEIGKFYMVKCAVIEDDLIRNKYIPIIGHPHADPEIGINKKHYHIDGRFTSRYVDKMGRCNSAVIPDNHTHQYGGFFKRIEILPKKCRRLTTGSKPPLINYLNEPSKWSIWYTKQLGKSCKGKKCPHLGTVMHECNGRLVCPLHNLQGDINTEKIIKAIELPSY